MNKRQTLKEIKASELHDKVKDALITVANTEGSDVAQRKLEHIKEQQRYRRSK